jgi:hypothetical protein
MTELEHAGWIALAVLFIAFLIAGWYFKEN